MLKKPIILTALILIFIILAIKYYDKVLPVNKLSKLTDATYVTYYKKACDLEDAEACNLLGDMYHYGRDVATDYEDAVEFYKKACGLENGSGCNNLGYMLNQGLGIEEQNWQALKLYEKACKYGEMEACYNVGAMYYSGEGSKRDYYKSALHFQKVVMKVSLKVVTTWHTCMHTVNM